LQNNVTNHYLIDSINNAASSAMDGKGMSSRAKY